MNNPDVTQIRVPIAAVVSNLEEIKRQKWSLFDTDSERSTSERRIDEIKEFVTKDGIKLYSIGHRFNAWGRGGLEDTYELVLVNDRQQGTIWFTSSHQVVDPNRKMYSGDLGEFLRTGDRSIMKEVKR